MRPSRHPPTQSTLAQHPAPSKKGPTRNHRFLPLFAMPRTILKAVRSGAVWTVPSFTARMVDRKLRWQLLRRSCLPFGILDKGGQKSFAQQHGADVPTTLAVIDRAAVASECGHLQSRLAALMQSSFVLKPATGYQNRNTYAVNAGHDLLAGCAFDADAVAARIARDPEFDTYLVEEFLCDEVGLVRSSPARGFGSSSSSSGSSGSGGGGSPGHDAFPAAGLPMDFKFWCFGSHIAHVTIMCERWKDATGGYHVDYADCDASYAPQPTWCTKETDVCSGAAVPLPPRPHCWDEMVAMVRRLGEAAGVFTRIDCYATPRGPVFGEFQLLFDLVDWNENAERAIRTHWRGRDGGVDGATRPARQDWSTGGGN